MRAQHGRQYPLTIHTTLRILRNARADPPRDLGPRQPSSVERGCGRRAEAARPGRGVRPSEAEAETTTWLPARRIWPSAAASGAAASLRRSANDCAGVRPYSRWMPRVFGLRARARRRARHPSGARDPCICGRARCLMAMGERRPVGQNGHAGRIPLTQAEDEPDDGVRLGRRAGGRLRLDGQRRGL